MQPAHRTKLSVLEPALCLLILGLALLSPRLLPFNMDEFSHYHQLGCHYSPLSEIYSRYVNGCGEYDLKPPGFSHYLPLRSYTYIGFPQILPFVPLWWAIDDPVAGRILGALYLILASFLIARVMQVRWRYALFASLILPAFVIVLLVQPGGEGLQMCVLLASLLSIRQGLSSKRLRTRVWVGVVTGITLFVGIAIKLDFFWALPALLVWALWHLRPASGDEWPGAIGRQLPFAASAALSFAIPALLLLLAIDRSGHPYFAAAASGGLSLRPWSLYGKFYYLGMLVTNSSMFDYRVMALNGNVLLDATPALIGLVILGYSLYLEKSPGRSAILLMLGLAALSFAFIITNSSAWAPHHLVFAVVFAVAAVARGLQTLAARRALVGVLIGASCLYWVSIVVRMPDAYIHTDTSFDKDRLTRFLRTSHLDANTVQLHASWGTYYISHTFGDRQQLAIDMYHYTYLPLEVQRRDMAEIRAAALKLKRDVLLITETTAGLNRTPVVVGAFGEPVQTYAFNTWQIARYHPQ